MWSASCRELFSEPNVPLDTVIRVLRAEVLSGEGRLQRGVSGVACTDMMSRVLAECPMGTLLLTRLANVQVVNTAVVAGLVGVVFLEGLRPEGSVIDRAKAMGLPLLRTEVSQNVARDLLRQLGPGRP